MKRKFFILPTATGKTGKNKDPDLPEGRVYTGSVGNRAGYYGIQKGRRRNQGGKGTPAVLHELSY